VEPGRFVDAWTYNGVVGDKVGDVPVVTNGEWIEVHYLNEGMTVHPCHAENASGMFGMVTARVVR
jgi:hypothetical protein